QNNDEDAAFDGKEHDFDVKKPESEVILSSSSSYRDLSAEFEDCSDSSSNEVNVTGSIVPTVGQNSLNGTNTFSDVGPSNAVVKQKKDGIFFNQDKYVAEILRKFGLTEGKSGSTLIDTEKPLMKDPDGEDVDVHTYSESKSFTPSCSKKDL
nr:retrovirus-related Pol polyprotein from transposon TNT 1-94 [Tanacetum cinerariifolium]